MSFTGLLVKVANRLSSEQVAETIIQKPELLDRIVADERTIGRWEKSGAIQDGLASHFDLVVRALIVPKLWENLLLSDSLLSKLLADSSFHERLLGDGALLSRLLADRRAFEKIITEQPLLAKILSDGRTIESILTDHRLLSNILSNGRTIDRIMSDEVLLNKLLKNGRVFAHLVNDSDLSNQLIQQGPIVKTALANDSFRRKIAKEGRVWDAVISDPELWRQNPFRTRWRSVIEFQETWDALEPFIEEGIVDDKAKVDEARSRVHGRNDIEDAVLGLISTGDEVKLRGARFRFPERHSLWVLLNEILIQEEYYFETDVERPRIIDCGAHFGLALYYFKKLHPNARITAFEPVPMLHAMATENVKTNGYTDVEILPCAVSGAEGKSRFFFSEDDSMAGSLTQRRGHMGDKVTEIEVENRRLSTFLNEPVHFLTLDIEGSEDEVLKEASDKLGAVQHIFCEYHHGAGTSPDRLVTILSVLHGAGFDVHMGKSPGSARSTSRRSMEFVGRPYSASIWAKNMNWKP